MATLDEIRHSINEIDTQVARPFCQTPRNKY